MRRRPPQRSEDEKSITASAVIIPHTAKPRTNPLKTIQKLLEQKETWEQVVGVTCYKAIAAVGAYLRVSGPLGPLTSVYARTKSNTTHSNDKI